MSITTTLQTLGQPNHPLSRRELKGLSGLARADHDEFWLGWQAVKPARRLEIVHATVELVEDNIDLEFSSVWRWLLDDADATVRASAIEGLWEDHSLPVLRHLMTLLRDDPSSEVRAAIAASLSRFAHMASLDELDSDSDADALHTLLVRTASNASEPVDVRRRALESAGYFADDVIVQQQIGVAYATDEQLIRESALVAMGRSMTPHWLPIIAKELGSSSPALRYEAARAAGEMAEEARQLVAQVAPLVADPDTEIALAAIWALGQIGGEPARRTLKRIRDAQEDTRSTAAAEALDEMSLGEALI